MITDLFPSLPLESIEWPWQETYKGVTTKYGRCAEIEFNLRRCRRQAIMVKQECSELMNSLAECYMAGLKSNNASMNEQKINGNGIEDDSGNQSFAHSMYSKMKARLTSWTSSS